jgi:hypothetical protein
MSTDFYSLRYRAGLPYCGWQYRLPNLPPPDDLDFVESDAHWLAR